MRLILVASDALDGILRNRVNKAETKFLPMRNPAEALCFCFLEYRWTRLSALYLNLLGELISMLAV